MQGNATNFIEIPPTHSRKKPWMPQSKSNSSQMGSSLLSVVALNISELTLS
jgi:hypothetical protein